MKWAIILALICAVLGAVGQIFLKMGSTQVSLSLNQGTLDFSINWKLVMGFVLYGISSILFIVALRGANLSVAYPMIATSYIWVSLLSVLVLHEAFPLWKWIGIALILGGVIVIGI